MTARDEFIEQIGVYVQKYAPLYDIRACSAVIGQAVLESGSGTSYKAKYHNYFGLKYRAFRCPTSDGTFKDGSTEQRADGSYYSIKDEWFSFPSMEAGVQGYFDFTNIATYATIKGVADPREYLKRLKAVGYASQKDYVERVMAVVDGCNLTRFDDVKETTMLPINRLITTINRTVLANKQNKYIVIHYTGNKTDKAVSNAKYFQNTNRGASAHYFVDENSIYQSVEDKDAAWSVGKNYGRSNLFGTVTNNNSISIEMCSTNGVIAKATLNNTVELCKYLMAKYGITAGNVYRHYDVCSKKCPAWDGWIPPNEAIWIQFKNQLNGIPVKEDIKEEKITPIEGAFMVRILCKKNDPLNIRKSPSASAKVVGTVCYPEVYTIVETQGNWGKLKSGAGWINISPNFVKRI